MRSAISGSVIANEVRAIAAWLSGNKIDPVKVKDLMINTDRPVKGSTKKADSDDAGALAYAKSWEASIKRKLAEAGRADQKPVRRIPKPRTKSVRRS